MSFLIKLSCILLSVSMSYPQSNKSLNDLIWIVDSWVSSDGETVSYEHWNKVNDTLFEGASETIKNGDTTFNEKLKIIIENNEIYYVADVKHNPAPVRFKLTGISEGKAVFENPEHDFPQKITYVLENGTMHAFIEGTNRLGNWEKVDFYYNKRR